MVPLSRFLTVYVCVCVDLWSESKLQPPCFQPSNGPTVQAAAMMCTFFCIIALIVLLTFFCLVARSAEEVRTNKKKPTKLGRFGG